MLIGQRSLVGKHALATDVNMLNLSRAVEAATTINVPGEEEEAL
jgi:hypothetical protein